MSIGPHEEARRYAENRRMSPRRDPVEHVRASCPRLIATLVAMARASADGQDVERLPDDPPRHRRRAQPAGGRAEVGTPRSRR
jgi:hypothetical protein